MFKYSEYLKEKYKEKTYKLPINLPVTCPNRDGNISFGGCTYCGEKGAGFENLSSSFSVRQQLTQNMEYIGNKYKAKKFIAYFQNFTNTYLPVEIFKNYMLEACLPNIVELCISTRPDCVTQKHLEVLNEININISIELGLQTVNYKTLKKINRGHGLAEFIDAVLSIKKYNFDICVHVILNLPDDDMEDIIECAKIISALGVNQVKLHALYIVKDTPLYEQYINNQLTLTTKEEYVSRAIAFLEYLSPEIAIQRLIGRAPKEDTAFANWNSSWWKVAEQIETTMLAQNTYQGKKFNYLGGSAAKDL